MNTTANFTQLVEALQETTSYKLNSEGEKLIRQYHDIIQKVENTVIPIVTPYVKDSIQTAKEIAVQIISTINSQQLGTGAYEIMSRLDTLTNGGKSIIDGNSFSFNQNDKILNYLEHAS